jgi:hypothetical protein
LQPDTMTSAEENDNHSWAASSESRVSTASDPALSQNTTITAHLSRLVSIYNNRIPLLHRKDSSPCP